MSKRACTALAASLALLCAAIPAPAAEEASPLAAARELYVKSCAACHPLERSMAKQADYAGWKQIIARMIANGAKLGPPQTDQIVGYLSAKSLFETKCNGCHDLAKPLAAVKDAGGWQATVAKMAAKKPPLLAAEEALAISQYLALARPAAAGQPAAPAAPAAPVAK